MQLIWFNVLVLLITILTVISSVNCQVLSSDYVKATNDSEIIQLPTLKRGKRYLDFTKGSRMSVSFIVLSVIFYKNSF